MRILLRLRLLRVVAVLGLVLLGCLLAWSMMEFKAATANNQLVAALNAQVFDVGSLRDKFFLHRDERAKEQWIGQSQKAERLIDQAKRQLQSPADLPVLEGLKRDLQDGNRIFLRIVGNARNMRLPGPDRANYEELDKRLLSQLLVKDAQLQVAANSLQRAGEQETSQAFRQLAIRVAAGTLLLALITTLTLQQVDRLIRKRLAILHAGAQVVAAGQYDFQLDEQGEDELAEVAQSINVMTKELRVIGERRQIQAVQLESERRFRTILSNVQLAAITLDAQGNVTFCNDFLLKLTGWQRGQVIGKNWFEWFLPESSRARVAAVFAATERGGTCPSHYENEVITRQGELRLIAWDNAQLRNELGQNICMASIGVDITERKRGEEALRQSEVRFRALFEKSSSVMLLADPATGSIVDANLAAVAYYGYPRARMLGMPLDQINTLPAEDIARELQLAVTEQRNYFNFQHRLASGDIRSVEVYSTPIVEFGRSVVVAIVHDITGRKQAEAHLRLAASVFSHASEGITITDAEGTIVDVNNAFTRITGYSREEAVGQNPRMLKSGLQSPEYYAGMWQSLIRDGHWQGELWNRHKGGEMYAELINISAELDDSGNVQSYVALFTDITATKKHQQQLEHIAHYDGLTSLPNRALLADRLSQAINQSLRRDTALAVVYLDLDGFKAVNDAHGHAVGDKLLVAITQRMKEALRDGDTLSRVGGDEFVAVLVDLSQPDDCEPILTRLLQAAAEPVTVGVAELRVSASIGVTVYPQDASDADLLMRHADQAMYQAKEAGKNRFHFFDLNHDALVQTRQGAVEHVGLALSRHEFVLHYQPKVNMKTGQVIGAEALIRWQHPELGLLPPSAFLPLIENHLVSVAMGEWVIDAALAQLSAWHALGLNIPISVNVGARQLQQGDFVTRLSELLSAHPDVPPGRLELEILETGALEEMTRLSATMRACSALGVHFALDDFGTGYSSLTYLRRLPAELLKIDQHCVTNMLQDPEDLAIVKAVIGLAEAFKRAVIAEGADSVEHGKLLLSLGCDLAQGYGIARPMPAADMPNWVTNWRPDAGWMM